MADYSWRTVETRTREYSLPSPTVGAQVKQVISKMEDELGPERARWDNAVIVTARDDQILFTYDVGSRTVPDVDCSTCGNKRHVEPEPGCQCGLPVHPCPDCTDECGNTRLQGWADR